MVRPRPTSLYSPAEWVRLGPGALLACTRTRKNQNSSLGHSSRLMSDFRTLGYGSLPVCHIRKKKNNTTMFMYNQSFDAKYDHLDKDVVISSYSWASGPWGQHGQRRAGPRGSCPDWLCVYLFQRKEIELPWCEVDGWSLLVGLVCIIHKKII